MKRLQSEGRSCDASEPGSDTQVMPLGGTDDIMPGQAELDAKAWLAAIVENSDDAILSKTLEGIVTSWNSGAERLFGFSAEEMLGRPILILIPEDRRSEESLILEKIRRGERVDHFETVRRRKDGSLVDISLTVSPVRNRDGVITGASKIARDISERKRQHERQLLLLREMNHRIKNLFTVTSALISLSERSATGAADLAASLRQRLSALARAHDFTLPDMAGGLERERTTTLFSLLGAILTPHNDADAPRTHVLGADFPIRAPALASLALALNEFATNSAKYGALSVAEGRLRVDSAVDGEDHVLVWTETGGPPPPSSIDRPGFGSQLERLTIAQALRGTATRDWRPEGLVITVRTPLRHLSG